MALFGWFLEIILDFQLVKTGKNGANSCFRI